jgi:tripartite-type tricarboxylate transporter receptor subunit TctC
MRQADGPTREETMMGRTRRRACALGALTLAAIAAFSPTAMRAQTYPNRPVHLIVPFAAGGSADVVARGLAQGLSEAWGHQVVVENKPGANTQIAAEFVAKSTPDGYTLLLGSEGTFVMNPFLYGKLPYDPNKDFVPITALVAINQVLAVNPSVPVRTIGELIALAKRSPATLSYGTTGFGSASHLNMEQLDRMAGIKTVAVHYRGSGPALADVIAGHVPLTFASIGLVYEPMKAGLVRLVAVVSPTRFSALPDVPTIAESGLPGFDGTSWFGLFAPAGTAREIVARLNTDVRKVFGDPAFRERFLRPNVLEPRVTSPEEFAAAISSGAEKWGAIIRGANLKAN